MRRRMRSGERLRSISGDDDVMVLVNRNEEESD